MTDHQSVELGPHSTRSFSNAFDRLQRAPGLEALEAKLAQPWLAPLASVAFLVVLTALVFRHQVFQGWTFPWDFQSTPVTTPAFVADTFGRGNPLSWTPFVASGFPRLSIRRPACTSRSGGCLACSTSPWCSG